MIVILFYYIKGHIIVRTGHFFYFENNFNAEFKFSLQEMHLTDIEVKNDVNKSCLLKKTKSLFL